MEQITFNMPFNYNVYNITIITLFTSITPVKDIGFRGACIA